MENGAWKFVKSVVVREKFNINLEINHISTFLCYHQMCHRADPVCPSSVPPTPPPLPFRIAPRFKATIPPTGISFFIHDFSSYHPVVARRSSFVPPDLFLLPIIWDLCVLLGCVSRVCVWSITEFYLLFIGALYAKMLREEKKEKSIFVFFSRTKHPQLSVCACMCVKIVTTRLS